MARHEPPRLGAAAGQRDALSLEAVVEAVSAVMMASDKDRVIDQALAHSIGSRIRASLADQLGGRVASGSELVGQQTFRNILRQHLSIGTVGMDDETRRAMQKFLRDNANRTGADFAAFVSQFRRGGGYGDRVPTLHDTRSDASSDSSGTSGERYSALPWSDAQLCAHAHHRGVGWMAHHPHLYRLGPAAIDALAEVQFRRETFERATRAGYRAETVVDLVRYARRTGRDAHETVNAASEAVEVLGGDDTTAQERWRTLYRNLGRAQTDAEREAARQALITAYTQHVDQHPQHRDTVVRGLRAHAAQEQAEQVLAAATAQTAVERTRVAENANELTALLGDDPPAATRPPSAQPTPHVAGPR